MKFADTIQCWEDIAYTILGDSPIESDAERGTKFQNFKIDFFSAEVSVHKYSDDMKVIRKFFEHFFWAKKRIPSSNIDRKQWFLYMVFGRW